ncbi:adenosine deaminase family protein [Candidatus Entotheonella palauensis]|uniref:Adenosine deaminase n=1 Tax=Candidatus Entotheonella gemina TaxID=1429439 RepID=W4MFA2_9BACT|nr:adenosine deaminase [Candidatus Entotheonella palauensis]ETX08616.1 MAG: adenosine deaminase [Candidatus Entotheonella gemina]
MDHPTNGRRELLARLPKVELHCHLLGTIRQPTMAAIAAKNRARTTREAIEQFYVRGEKPVGVLHIFRELETHILANTEDFYRIAYEYGESIAPHTVRYAEVFWNPTGTLKQTHLSYPELQGAILRGFSDAEHDFGVTCRLIPSIDRQASASEAVEMVQLVIVNRDANVIGIGMDYNEVDRPPELFTEAYALAKRHGLKATTHAGEFGMPWTNVETALTQLRVDRIDHGYTVLDNPELTARCAELSILFTVVPSNSYYLRTLTPEQWAIQHPIRHMARAGLQIHPNTDDPAFHLINPTQCWERMVTDFGYGLSDLRDFMCNGLSGAWIDEEMRRRWLREWTVEFDDLVAEAVVGVDRDDGESNTAEMNM